MSECKNIDSCGFFEKYKEENELGLNGFINQYCKGDKMDECVRRELAKELGGTEKIPDNMLPNGYPISGTDKSDWSEEVIKLARNIS
ncbi:MAG: hypothetical protein BTN85_0320 [Candidatus Methanohalarchaeum thermophilum]|uniref:Uncharacterized protein n=1 Tax=Methanohalarchaeum thermophilum TaxID=1903181 RepID=A0A1Q6DU23_METT1|nr:MAG: hypothetical protein BTN85_0320 [Candidatus Methanohalarchaeum thermophilum]